MSQQYTINAGEISRPAADPAGAAGMGGFSLLEVLIAVLVLSIGLLGLATLQATSLGFNHDAYARSQATLMAYDITDRMRANRDNASDYIVQISSSDCANNPTSGITGSSLAANDLRTWAERICQLPFDDSAQLQGEVASDGNGYRVTVSWHDRYHETDSQSDSRSATTVEFYTEI